MTLLPARFLIAFIASTISFVSLITFATISSGASPATPAVSLSPITVTSASEQNCLSKYQAGPPALGTDQIKATFTNYVAGTIVQVRISNPEGGWLTHLVDYVPSLGQCSNWIAATPGDFFNLSISPGLNYLNFIGLPNSLVTEGGNFQSFYGPSYASDLLTITSISSTTTQSVTTTTQSVTTTTAQPVTTTTASAGISTSTVGPILTSPSDAAKQHLLFVEVDNLPSKGTCLTGQLSALVHPIYGTLPWPSSLQLVALQLVGYSRTPACDAAISFQFKINGTNVENVTLAGNIGVNIGPLSFGGSASVTLGSVTQSIGSANAPFTCELTHSSLGGNPHSLCVVWIRNYVFNGGHGTQMKSIVVTVSGSVSPPGTSGRSGVQYLSTLPTTWSLPPK